jgi:opacity protein-like surface antigen
MKKNIVILIVVFALVSLSAEKKELKTALGFAGGMISGSGFSFRNLNNKNGFQINFGAIMQNVDCDYCFEDELPEDFFTDTNKIYTLENTNSYSNINIGLNFYSVLHNGKRSKLYVIGGGAGYFSIDLVYEQNYDFSITHHQWETVDSTSEHKEINMTLNIGGGFGFEYKLSDNIALNLEWPLVVSFFDRTTNIYMYIPQAGIHYYFK